MLFNSACLMLLLSSSLPTDANSKESQNNSQNSIEDISLGVFVVVSFIALLVIFFEMHRWKYEFLFQKYERLANRGRLPAITEFPNPESYVMRPVASSVNV